MTAQTDERIILVTGGSGGIGREIIQRSLQDGYRIINRTRQRQKRPWQVKPLYWRT